MLQDFKANSRLWPRSGISPMNSCSDGMIWYSIGAPSNISGVMPLTDIASRAESIESFCGGGNHCMEYLNKSKTLYLDCRNFQNCIFSA